MADKEGQQQMNSRAKEIVYNVSERFFNSEGSSAYLQSTAEATGVSASTIWRIRKEMKETGKLLSPQRPHRRGP